MCIIEVHTDIYPNGSAMQRQVFVPHDDSLDSPCDNCQYYHLPRRLAPYPEAPATTVTDVDSYSSRTRSGGSSSSKRSSRKYMRKGEMVKLELKLPSLFSGKDDAKDKKRENIIEILGNSDDDDHEVLPPYPHPPPPAPIPPPYGLPCPHQRQVFYQRDPRDQVLQVVERRGRNQGRDDNNVTVVQVAPPASPAPSQHPIIIERDRRPYGQAGPASPLRRSATVYNNGHRARQEAEEAAHWRRIRELEEENREAHDREVLARRRDAEFEEVRRRREQLEAAASRRERRRSPRVRPVTIHNDPRDASEESWASAPEVIQVLRPDVPWESGQIHHRGEEVLQRAIERRRRDQRRRS